MAADTFAEALSRRPPITELPWMRVELQGETGQWFVFGLAVHEGWVVAVAPVARRMFGHRARDVWKIYRSRGAKLMRLDAHVKPEACGVLPHWPGAATGAATAWVVRLSASGWEAVLERCNGTTWVDHRGRAWKLRNIPMAFRFDNKEHAESAAVLAALSLKHGG